MGEFETWPTFWLPNFLGASDLPFMQVFIHCFRAVHSSSCCFNVLKLGRRRNSWLLTSLISVTRLPSSDMSAICSIRSVYMLVLRLCAPLYLVSKHTVSSITQTDLLGCAAPYNYVNAPQLRNAYGWNCWRWSWYPVGEFLAINSQITFNTVSCCLLYRPMPSVLGELLRPWSSVHLFPQSL